MIESINSFLSPIENIIKNNRKYIGYFFILLAFASLYYLWIPFSTKDSWENAILLLWILLWIPIFARVFGLRIFQMMMPLRKELGILMGVLACIHALSYTITDRLAITHLYFWWQNWFVSYFAFGFFALIFTILLTLTSSDWAMRKMWKYWKLLHKTIYIIILLVVTHVVLIKFSRTFEYTPVITLVLYFIFKILEWKNITFAKRDTTRIYPVRQKWLCIPCWYIYDPLIWDEDSGIAPGTEFTDIPDSWVCPICGVRKSDFVPYEEWSEEVRWYNATIIEKNLLNPTTLELIIETDDNHVSIAWQFMSFLWKDNEWEFTRSYTIVHQEWMQYTFTIKLWEFGRAARILRDTSIWATIRIKWIFGHFILHDCEKQKIFIATGTGLAPIYNMLTALSEWSLKSLYFSVATESELFYIDKLRAIPNLDLHIHITREKVEWYETWRVNVDSIEAVPNAEWYLCGNPKMVSETREKLTKRWFTNIYSEEF